VGQLPGKATAQEADPGQSANHEVRPLHLLPFTGNIEPARLAELHNLIRLRLAATPSFQLIGELEIESGMVADELTVKIDLAAGEYFLEFTVSSKNAPPVISSLRMAAADMDLPATLLERLGDAFQSPLAEPRPDTGMFTVHTLPLGATVYLDTQPCPSVTPLTLRDLAPGEHTLLLALGDLPDVVLQAKIEPGRLAVIEQRMGAAVGRLEIVTLPPGAAVAVDGVELGRAPLSLTSVPVGRRLVRAHAKNFRPTERPVEVLAGQSRKVVLILAPLPGRLLVTSQPKGARVYLDGVELGQTILTTEVPPGRHQLELAAPGYANQQRTIFVRPEDEQTHAFILEPGEAEPVEVEDRDEDEEAVNEQGGPALPEGPLPGEPDYRPAWFTLGVGGSLLLLGGVSWALAADRMKDYRRVPQTDPKYDRHAPSYARRMALTGDVVFGLGLAVAASSVFLFLYPPNAEPAVVPSLGGGDGRVYFGLGGTF